LALVTWTASYVVWPQNHACGAGHQKSANDSRHRPFCRSPSHRHFSCQ
jgi:hypothetical protein